MSFLSKCSLKKIKDIGFNIYKGKSYNSSDVVENDDESSINYITRTEKNNGIKSKVLNENFANVEKGNAITIGDTTATVFYQKDDFIVGEHMVIIRSNWLDEYSGLFISLQLRREKFRYPAFARAFTKDLIAETEVLVPLNEKNEVDVEEIKKYIIGFDVTKDNVVSEIPDYFLNEGYTKACWYMDNIDKNEFEKQYASSKIEEIVDLKSKKWKDFNLCDFYEPVQSKGDIKMSEIIEGDIPLVSAIKINNGIANYIMCGDGVAEKFSRGCLTADMFGHVFYQANDFYAVSHGRVNILVPKIETNIYIGTFFAVMLQYQFEIRNSYSRMLTQELLQKCVIRLPINSKKEVDYEFMERYIKSRPFSCNL